MDNKGQDSNSAYRLEGTTRGYFAQTSHKPTGYYIENTVINLQHLALGDNGFLHLCWQVTTTHKQTERICGFCRAFIWNRIRCIKNEKRKTPRGKTGDRWDSFIVVLIHSYCEDFLRIWFWGVLFLKLCQFCSFFTRTDLLHTYFPCQRGVISFGDCPPCLNIFMNS